ncbi:dehydrogenase [Candidatus Desantisbacteria bacterium CG_4_10_14_0_8_um_filter_48_22]|uniref:Dehydrogenase n=1 Tax=Candidatus Desantisbacteria bacterium CG_4_10_14_0_8_um_filter_48_22 TaxID=1974543 RepID=A0A2M7SEQ1_9BACT|nr:MAG: dehydrogenase [Candidatus Desantisbacteria bacterium CG1_02_49_89]PIV57364.1 MAG: dehydrogenase [Candidatus Desantisbacteria bacterium CG02_land_8_20_14_3_00_49_13]PIZ18012.1 MAG: dehydrogenase [Candidatus Desantisbacteria bacterium CG_4_10_14_0_8_um_filter_48_22]
MKKIKAGIIGTGFIGPAHVEAARRLGFVDMVALAEAGDEIAKQKAEKLCIPKAYGDYKEMLADKEIQVVHNCTPNSLHVRISSDIIKAGKHVISEKPLAMNSEEGTRLVSLAKEKGVVNAVDFNYRYYPLVQEAKAMIKKGKLGTIYTVMGSYLQDWLYLDTDYNWRVEPELGGNPRAVGDVGSHWCDLIQFITGSKIDSIFADMKIIHEYRKKPKKAIETYAGKELKPADYESKKVLTEDYATLLLNFDNGSKGVLTVCQCCAGRKNRLFFEVYGSKSAVVWDQETPNEMWIGYREKANEILVKDPSLLSPEAKAYAFYPGGHPEAYPDGLKNFLLRVYSFIAEGKDPVRDKPDFSTFVDGNDELLICDAVLESSKSAKWVAVKR